MSTQHQNFGAREHYFRFVPNRRESIFPVTTICPRCGGKLHAQATGKATIYTCERFPVCKEAWFK